MLEWSAACEALFPRVKLGHLLEIMLETPATSTCGKVLQYTFRLYCSTFSAAGAEEGRYHLHQDYHRQIVMFEEIVKITDTDLEFQGMN